MDETPIETEMVDNILRAISESPHDGDRVKYFLICCAKQTGIDTRGMMDDLLRRMAAREGVSYKDWCAKNVHPLWEPTGGWENG